MPSRRDYHATGKHNGGRPKQPMAAPLRLSPIAPPPLPSFVKARPGTLPGAVASDRAVASGQSRGFSLDLAHTEPIGSSTQPASPLAERLRDAVVDQVTHVDALQSRAKSLRLASAAGGASVNDTEVLTASQKADLAFHLLMEIRNKLMDAYREVQQIQI